MAFTLAEFAATRPYLYHLTSPRNCERLLRSRVLYSTAELLSASNNHDWLDQKRPGMLTITLDGELIDIRDQQPLYPGKTTLEGGWTFSQLISALNARVFFWPGWEEEAISYGQHHFERYAADGPTLMRVNTQELFDANVNAEPLFCKYNSGAPRTTKGKGSPRGPNTFVACDEASFTPCQVVEVTYLGSVVLPENVTQSDSPNGPWETAE